MKEVRIEYDTILLSLPTTLQDSYEHYLDVEFRQKFYDDRPRFMLRDNPVSFSDLPTLRLKVKRTSWSQLRFYQDHILAVQGQTFAHLERFLAGEIAFPNSLALFLVVATSDGYVLLTKTSNKVHYYPEHWACSIGEHLDQDDLRGAEEDFALNWVGRALSEELGVGVDAFERENVRAMAVVLEAQLLSPAVVAVVVLNLDRSNLDAIIDKHPRTDYEFQDWEFISWESLPAEMCTPTKTYHPSTGIRMLYAGLFRFGAPGLSRRMMQC